MAFAASKRVRLAQFATLLGLVGGMPGPSTASYVIESTASFPVIPMSFASPTGAGCFDVAMVCVTPGTFTLTSANSSFSGGNQDITGMATYTGSLTPLIGNTSVGDFTLTGPVDLEVFGRTSNMQTGTWNTELTSLSLSGPLDITDLTPPYGALNGHTLLATLGSHPSTGMLSIVESVPPGEYGISSFFDVFIDVSLKGTGLSTSVGPIAIAGIPEPPTWMLLIGGFGALGALRLWRASRRTAPACDVCDA